jgi:peptidoglycan/xylan/chitin deacetylase (PgdA/CDA1 family)
MSDLRMRQYLDGGMRWIQRRRRRSSEAHGLVLMYHRIAHPTVDPWRLCVRPERFEEQMRLLRDRIDVVPLGELRTRLRSGRRGRPVAAVTFDDGYADNLHVAKPVLQRYGVPATVFLATAYVGSARRFWWDALAQSVLAADALPRRIELECAGRRFSCDDPRLALSNDLGRRARGVLHDRLWQWLSSLADQDRRDAIGVIQSWAPDARPPAADELPMTDVEVRSLIAEGLVEIGAHTANHCMLSALPSAAKAVEIEQSWRDCRRLAGRDPRSFAYPHGDFDEESVDLVKRTGFTVSCTTEQDLVWSQTDPHTTPRIGVPDCSGRALLHTLRRWLA